MIVFIVEPDQLLAKQYAESLSERQDCFVVMFRTANLAIKALEKAIPDIIMIELAMPGHNGFEFLYELQSYADTREVKVVVNSFIREDDVPFGFVNREEFGIVEYLHKPFASLSDIKKAVYAVA